MLYLFLYVSFFFVIFMLCCIVVADSGWRLFVFVSINMLQHIIKYQKETSNNKKLRTNGITVADWWTEWLDGWSVSWIVKIFFFFLVLPTLVDWLFASGSSCCWLVLVVSMLFVFLCYKRSTNIFIFCYCCCHCTRKNMLV